MKIRRHTPAYILPLTLLMLGGIMAIVTYLFIRSTTFSPLEKTLIMRDKARMAALAGMEIGVAQLAQPFKKNQEKEGEQQPGQEKKSAEPNADERATLFLMRLLPNINRWQEFPLKDNAGKDAGEIKIAISCEQGKIDINHIFDFKKKKFVGDGAARGDWKRLLQFVFDRVQKQIGSSTMLESLETYLKTRGRPLDDVTQLLTIKEFAPFKNRLFYEPEQESALFLTDLFTVHSDTKTIEPWLLSHALASVLELTQKQSSDRAAREKMIKDLLKGFKRNVQWANDWNKLLAPLYGKELQSLPKDIESMFNTPFEPKTFAILSYGTVQEVTQRLLAIVEWSESTDKKSPAHDIIVKRLYWL